MVQEISGNNQIHNVTLPSITNNETFVLSGTIQTLSNKVLVSPEIRGTTNLTNAVLSGDSPLVFEGFTSEGTTNRTTLAITDPTAARTITLPDATGTVSLTNGNETLTKTLTSLTGPAINGSSADGP